MTSIKITITKTILGCPDSEVRRVLDAAGPNPGYIFNLGHGMIPSAKIECVAALMETVTGQSGID